MHYRTTKENEALHKVPEGLSPDDLSILFAVYRDHVFLRAFDTLGEAERYAHKRGGCWIAVYVPDEEV